MSEQPQVVCVMLTADRHELAAKAIEYFRAQTYERKRLLVLDTGNESTGYLRDYADIRHNWADLSLKSWPIGRLRNLANERAADRNAAEIIVTWDDDDYSAPTRIAEQVAFLQASGAEAVGYSEMLFSDMRKRPAIRLTGGIPAIPLHAGTGQMTRDLSDLYQPEAWLFRAGKLNWALGTSLCYWTRTWQRVPFPETLTGRGEDTAWQQGLKVSAQTGFCPRCHPHPGRHGPRMIARIHAGNTSNPAYNREEMARNAKLPGVLRQWERAPQFDQICREVLGCA